jgi:predicted RNase H-like HicB family nuclease
MLAANCGIVVERLNAECYRATSLNFPDCQAVAASAEEARQAVEEAIGRILHERQRSLPTTGEESESP